MARKPSGKKINMQPFQITLALVLFFFGILLTAQFRTQVAVSNSLESQTADDLSAIILSLSESRNDLVSNLATLQRELRSIEEKANAGMSLSATVNQQIRQLNMVIGRTAIEGPGVSVTITGDSPLMYLDLIDLVNELFGSGAEAVAINNTRICFNTVISEGYNEKGQLGITIDGKELLSPVVIKAIGNADTLEKGLTYTGGIINMFNVLYQLYPVVKKEQSVHIPAASYRPPAYIKYE